jgi:type IV fimbrial biogenesis protein FimT
MSMIELMVGIAIVAILFMLAAPSFSNWIQNTQIRTAAEAIQSGLMLARGEAVSRNTTVRFQLTNALDNTCLITASPVESVAIASTGRWVNWVVSLDNPSGACDSAPMDSADPNPPAPRIIQTRAGAEGSRNAMVAASQATIVFNGLGRRAAPPPPGDTSTVNIDITNPIGGACVADAPPGPMRCLRIVVSPGGQVRMCDPAFAFSSTYPQGC